MALELGQAFCVCEAEATIANIGISTALLTPFQGDGSLNLPLLCEHANGTLRGGANGVTLFGTTGEGASVGLNERPAAISAMIDSGIPADKMILGVGGSAISDVVTQIQQGLQLGVTIFLLLPPYYFKDLNDAGLFEWYSRLFEATDQRAKFILYHIPQVTQVPLSLELVKRLRATFPERVLAIKDSAGQWDNTLALLDSGIIPVLVGDERLLHKAASRGAAGSICGMANFHPGRLRTIFDTQTEDVALSEEVDVIVSVPIIPALKQFMAARTGNPGWSNLRAPLQALQGADRSVIAAHFSRDKVA